MPEKITTLSIVRAMPFEKLDDSVPYKKLIIDNYDTRFTADDRYETAQIVWNAFAAISEALTKQEIKADEWPDAPLNIVAETAEKLRPFLNRRFSMDEMYPISQEVIYRFYGGSSQQEAAPKKKHWWQR